MILPVPDSYREIGYLVILATSCKTCGGATQNPKFPRFGLNQNRGWEMILVILGVRLKIHEFLEILSSKASELANSLVPKPQIGPNFISQGYIMFKNSVHWGRQFGSGPFTFTSPSVRPSRPHTYTKMKVNLTAYALNDAFVRQLPLYALATDNGK